jgi:amidase
MDLIAHTSRLLPTRLPNLLPNLLLTAAMTLVTSAIPAAPIDLTQASIADLEKAMDKGQLTSEKLTELYLARIKAYDKQGPAINAVITLNPNALKTARALDAERKAKGPRGPLHGIPVILKDNYNTADLPTTAGSFLLKGSLPPEDAFLVKKLRDAGAIILAKVNLSEFASGGAHSSIGGQTLNPHDLTRTPSGSSGGTGAGIAAVFAPLGMGTDTGGSIRGPSTSNGVVGLKPTHGLLSRNGIVPLALTFDTGGPLALNVADVAAALGPMTGVDPGDAATQKSEGKLEKHYTRYLKADALKGARIGIARDFMGQDQEVDWVIEASLAAMRKQGATVIEVRYPKWLLETKTEFYNVIRRPEFVAQINEYLVTLKPGYPRSHQELMELSQGLTSPRDGFIPNESRWALFKDEAASGTLSNPQYLAVRDHALPLVRAEIEGIIASNQLDAIVYPTSPRRPGRIDADPVPSAGGGGESATNFANLTGFPDLIVPAGFTTGGLPVGISFFGPAFSEPKLLALGYSFEQATKARRLPVHTPALPGERIGE